jgi:hypothetical protein
MKVIGVCIPKLKGTVAPPTDNHFAVRRYCDSGGTILTIPKTFFLLCPEIKNDDGSVIRGAHYTFIIWERGNRPHPL